MNVHEFGNLMGFVFQVLKWMCALQTMVIAIMFLGNMPASFMMK